MGELGAAYLRRLARNKAALHAIAAPSQAKVAAIYRTFLRRLHFQVIRGMCLQVYLYALHRDCVVSGRPQPAVRGQRPLSAWHRPHPHLLHFSHSCRRASHPLAQRPAPP